MKNNIVTLIQTNQNYFEDFVTRSTYHSNGIEGNTLSYAETYAIIFNDNTLKVNAKPREIYEAINHKYALNYILNHVGDELSQEIIKHIAIQINKNIEEISGYRSGQVFIKGAEHIPMPPNQVPQAMMYYVHNYNHTEYTDIYEKLAATHLEFERIHPFGDGNGRTGRLLINFELIKNNLPPIVIPKDDRTQYFKYLADQNTKELGRYFKELNEKEYEQIKTFAPEFDEMKKDTVIKESIAKFEMER